MDSTYFVDIEKLSPTHYYLSQKKLKSAEVHFESHSLEDYPPLPVIKYGDQILLVGGHHFAYYISTQGKLITKVCEIPDKSNFFLALKLGNECAKKKIFGIKDLKKRILDEKEYEEKWIAQYEASKSKLTQKPLSGLRYKKITDPQEKIDSANKILSPFPSYFTNEFIYKKYIEKIKEMSFLSFCVYNRAIAFVALRPLYDNVIEIYMLGVCESVENEDLLNKIMDEIKKLAKKLNKKYITVKIPLKTPVQNKSYLLFDFYTKYGFSHIENLDSPWDEKRLCMLLIKH